MDTILVSLIVLLLAVIALELYAILLRLGRHELTARETEPRRDSPGSGQTINVNLGTPGAGGTASNEGQKTLIVPTPEFLAAEQAKKAAEERERDEQERKLREAAEEREREAAERAARAALRRQTPSGAYAVTCPECGKENSSYRTECFNCGKAL